MLKMILVIILMGIAAYFRFNYDRKYVLPAIKENGDLSFLNKWLIILIAVAIGCFIMHLTQIGFVLLLISIPCVLYLNFKSNWIAWNNRKKDQK